MKPTETFLILLSFQQQNQTFRCYVMYTDFFRCEKILGEGHEACKYFKKVYEGICPSSWVKEWDEARMNKTMTWHMHRSQGEFPGHKYGS